MGLLGCWRSLTGSRCCAGHPHPGMSTPRVLVPGRALPGHRGKWLCSHPWIQVLVITAWMMNFLSVLQNRILRFLRLGGPRGVLCCRMGIQVDVPLLPTPGWLHEGARLLCTQQGTLLVSGAPGPQPSLGVSFWLLPPGS